MHQHTLFDLHDLDPVGDQRITSGLAQGFGGFLDHELIVDLFAGGGGASCGIERALGRSPDIAINHDPAAIAMHAQNHPRSRHYRSDVWEVDPQTATHGGPVGLLWLSPDCTHFSRAKGGTPVRKQTRSLAWVGIRWAAAVRPRIIVLENVPEFTSWGPISGGQPIPARAGETFRRFVGRLEHMGYRVDWRCLSAHHYGAPTSRTRLFLVARCDGEPIGWPEPSHGPGRHPYRSAASCIDWTIPCPSIFARAKPLAEASARRVATGIMRYVVDRPPYLVPVSPGPGGHGHQVAAFIARHFGGMTAKSITEPYPTITSKGCQNQLVMAHMAPCDQADDRPSADAVAAFVVRYYSSGGQWSSLHHALHTIPTKGRFGLVTCQLQGTPWAITDIGMRMLIPRELARAQGFPDDYVLTGTITEQIARIGNSVCPVVAQAVVAAQHGIPCAHVA